MINPKSLNIFTPKKVGEPEVDGGEGEVSVCPRCSCRFDASVRSPICPHARLLTLQDISRKLAAVKLIGKRVRVVTDWSYRSQVPYLIREVTWCGKLTLYGRAEEFDPGELEVVGD